MLYQLSEIAEKIDALILGNHNLEINSISSSLYNNPNTDCRYSSIVFINKYDLNEESISENNVVLLDKSIYEKFKIQKNLTF